MAKKEKSKTKKFEDYYIGLDLGTSSVGWAVTDLNYNILKFNQKAMWGVRLFEEGKTAEERRVARSARRRLTRRNQRIKLLQELFAEEISKVDMGFYQRIKESYYHKEDKTEFQTNSIFNDENYTDQDYHQQFPTIGHLKVALMESDDHFDVRLVYLAIANILKHRGHFIFEGKDLQSVRSFDFALDQFLDSVNNYLGVEHIDIDSEDDFGDTNIKPFAPTDKEKLKNLLKDDSKNISTKKKEITDLFETKNYGSQKKLLETFLHSIVGATVDIKNMIDESQAANLDEEVKFTFKDVSFDEKADVIGNILLERMTILETAKALHDWALLEDVLDGENSISKADVKRYEEHKEDLKLLKHLIKRDFDKSVYDEIFRADDIADNYYAYITGWERDKGKDRANRKKCTQEELCKFLNKKLANMKEDSKNPTLDLDLLAKKQDYVPVFERINANEFLPKQRDNKNTVVPYQINENDLRRILEKASKYLGFLSEKDERGISVADKIIKLHTFRIPYFVGPLNTSHQGEAGVNNWIVKKSDERILPWNFEDGVDLEKSAEGFIKRMTNKCSYLIGADVLPKNSLLYSEFMVLNELNNLRVDGDKLSIDVKQRVIKGLFEKHKKVTVKKLKDFLWKEGFKESREMVLTGIDDDLKASLGSLIDFKKILKKESLTDNDKEMIEGIISSIVIFGENKKILKERIKKDYKELTPEQIKEILKLNYKDWGNLSKEFLKEIEGTDPLTGEVRTLMAALRESDKNMMELLGASGGFNKAVEDYNAKELNVRDKIEYSMLDSFYISPAVKRSLWQTIKIVDEIRNITKKDPKKIFVEVQREEGEKKATKSRKDSLIELYKSLKTEEGKKMLEELQARGQSELNSRAMYLYYTQLGKCMYSGETIPLSQINDKNLYDLDHIIPRSLKKDDSLDNLVLVKKELNQRVKKDYYPVPSQIRSSQKVWWEQLLKQNLISKSKFERLTRVSELSDNELADFINRQLVETRQSSKAAIQVLSQMFPETDVVYSKAGNVSDFRKKYDFIKVREVNDYHHAKDAYLNIVVGNFFDTKFTKSPIKFIQKSKENNEKYTTNEKFMYNYDVERGGVTAWVADKKDRVGTIKTVERMMAKNNIQHTRLAYEEKGAISDANPLRRGKGQLQLKNDPKMSIDKYGGYNNISGSYYVLVEHKAKKGIIKTLEVVPVHLVKTIENNPKALQEYLSDELQLVDFKIIIPKIKKYSLVEINGFPAHITGRSNKDLIIRNAMQLVLPEDQYRYIKKLSRYLERNTAYKKSGSKENLEVTNRDGISLDANMKLYDQFIEKLSNTKYKEKYLDQSKNLEERRDIFEGISIEDQASVLMEILHFMQCNRVTSDLRKIGGAGRAGAIIFNKNISKLDSFKIINQSITGLFTQEIEII